MAMENYSEEKFILHVVALAHDSRGIGFIPGKASSRGKAVFVQGSLPGHVVLCKKLKETSNFMEAELIEILDPGPNARKPHCPHASVCGACPLQTMPYALQLEWKEKLVKDALIRIGGLNEQELEKSWQGIHPSPKISEFRNKFELAFGIDAAGQPALGFRQRRGHEVFNLKSCALVKAQALPIIQYFQNLLPQFKASDFGANNSFLKNLILRESEDLRGENVWHALLLTDSVTPEKQRWLADMGRELLRKIPECISFRHESMSGKSWSNPRKRQKFYLGNDAMGKEAALSYKMEGRLFNLSHASFFQVNLEAAKCLAKLAIKMDLQCSHDHGLLDIYCGCGMPGLLLGYKYPYAFGIDSNKAAIKNARLNAREEGRWTFCTGDAGVMLKKQPKISERPWSTILADPPRAGLNTRVVKAILDLSPRNIIYISCNPSTLARDMKNLGFMYKLKEISSVDLFPHTPHTECCVLLERRPC